MSEDKVNNPLAFKHPVPIPYAVLGLGWVLALIATNRFFHEIPVILWIAGPGLMIAKLYFDAEIIGRKKDNPPPQEYNLHAPGVWAQLDQTIKTLPGYFKNLSVNVNYQNLHPQKGMPMQMDAIITLRHPDVDKETVTPAKQNDMKSTLVMRSTIMPMGNKSILTIQFTADPLIGRKQLDDIIDHIMQSVDLLVKQHIK